MKKEEYLTQTEFSIMKILWNSDRPMSFSEILEKNEDGLWSVNSFHPTINNLIKKGFVDIEGQIKRTKAPSRLFVAKISLAEYTAMQINNVFEDKKSLGFNVSNFMSRFIYSNTIDEENLIEDLEKWIEEKKKNNNK